MQMGEVAWSFLRLSSTWFLRSLLAVALSSCGPSEGSKEWCERLERTAMSQWSMHDAEVFHEVCELQKVAEESLNTIKSVLDLLKSDIGRYPSADEGLSLLLSPPTDPTLRDRWAGPYLKGDKTPLDPWGKPYLYSPAGKEPGSIALYTYVGGKPDGKIIGWPPRN